MSRISYKYTKVRHHCIVQNYWGAFHHDRLFTNSLATVYFCTSVYFCVFLYFSLEAVFVKFFLCLRAFYVLCSVLSFFLSSEKNFAVEWLANLWGTHLFVEEQVAIGHHIRDCGEDSGDQPRNHQARQVLKERTVKQTREYWMIYIVPGFLAVVWFCMLLRFITTGTYFRHFGPRLTNKAIPVAVNGSNFEKTIISKSKRVIGDLKKIFWPSLNFFWFRLVNHSSPWSKQNFFTKS